MAIRVSFSNFRAHKRRAANLFITVSGEYIDISFNLDGHPHLTKICAEDSRTVQSVIVIGIHALSLPDLKKLLFSFPCSLTDRDVEKLTAMPELSEKKKEILHEYRSWKGSGSGLMHPLRL